MAALYSDQEQHDAMAAASAAEDGTKEAAFLGVWQSRLGTNPTLNLYRDAEKVWSASIVGPLPISGSAFVVPGPGAVSLITDADIDSGAWQFRIENAANPSVYYGADVTKAGGTDTLALSDDIDDEVGVTLGTIVFNAPSLDTEDAAIGVGDPRVVCWVDPNYAFAAQPTNALLQVRSATDGQGIRAISEPGLVGAGGDYTLSRSASPYGDGTCFRHRISPSFPLWQNTQRSQYTNGTYLQDGTTYWLAHEFTVESDWETSGDGFSVGDIHHNSWSVGPYGVLPAVRAPIELALCGTAPSYSIRVHGNYVPGSGGRTETLVYSSGTVSVGETHRFVVRFRVGRSAADGAFVQVWRQVDNGSESLIADRADVPIGYADMIANQCYMKMGLYAWTPAAPQRTVYTKGAVLLREASGNPTISAAEMFNLLRSL